MWGTDRPMKATGPQKAVVVAVSQPVTSSRRFRVSRVLIPRFSAYCSPRSKALSGLINKSEAANPAMFAAA